VRSVGHGRVAARPRRKDARQIDEPGAEIHDTEPGHGAAREIVREERLQRRPRFRKVIVLPERRPRQDEQQKSDLDEEGDVDEAADQRVTPASARW
jgi:hypothetical protein